MSAQPLQARPEFRGEFVLGPSGRSRRGNRRVESRGSEGEAAVDEITENVGQVLVHAIDEALDRKVGIGILRRVGGEPPAPAVGGKQRQSRVCEYPALPAGRGLSAFTSEPFEALDDIRYLVRQSRPANHRAKSLSLDSNVSL